MIRALTLVAYAPGISRLRKTSIARLTVGAALLFAAFPAAAGPGERKTAQGVDLVRRGDCARAIPLLEDAERARHRPSSAVPLADCYAARGDLDRASEIYRAVSAEQPARFWMRADYNAQKSAQKSVADGDARVPTVRFAIEGEYEGLVIEVDGAAIPDPGAERRVPIGVAVPIVVRAKGRVPHEEKPVFALGEHRVVRVHLEPLPSNQPLPPARAPEPLDRPSHPTWLGARYRGGVIPRFAMNFFAEGGRSLVVPGGGVTLTVPARGVDVVLGLGYLSYRMPTTPFKPAGTPDTEWEHVSSSLQALTLSVDLLWSVPLDARKTWAFRFGGGVGVGWTFLGDLYRTQVYPVDGKPGDPSTYLPCQGPNDPKGTFRYCNKLDKDATHYPGYTEPSWFQHGIRPLIFPWLVLPEVGLVWRPTPRFAIDLETGLSAAGVLTSLGVRYAL